MGMVVDSFSGMLAFKSTHLTRWLINPPITEVHTLSESLQHDRCIIEWEGCEPTETATTEASICELANQQPDDIVGKTFILKIKINKINNPRDWWFHACIKCCKKMVPTGAIRKCPICARTEDSERYKLSFRAEDICPTETDTEVIGDFMFFGNQGIALIGREPSLLVSQVRGRLDYLPSAITDVLGKTYTVTAQVNQDTYDTNPGHIMFKVSAVQPYIQAPEESAAAESPKLPAAENTALTTSSSTAKANQSKTAMDPESTPVKDVLEFDPASSEETTTLASTEKKEKTHSNEARHLKKGPTIITREQPRRCSKPRSIHNSSSQNTSTGQFIHRRLPLGF